jgi:hypothetical protein
VILSDLAVLGDLLGRSSPALSSVESEDSNTEPQWETIERSNYHAGHAQAHSHPREPHPYDHIDPNEVRQRQHQRNRYKPTHDDIDRLFSTLKQCVRDWSTEVYHSSLNIERLFDRELGTR